MRRNSLEVSRLDAKIWLEIERYKDQKTGFTERTAGTDFFKTIKRWMIEEEPDADPWDQRVQAAIDGFDERHKPRVPKEPGQLRLIQPKAIWKLDNDRSIVVPEGEANRDAIDLRITVIQTVYDRQRAAYETEIRFLIESRKRAKNRKQTMMDIWCPDNTK